MGSSNRGSTLSRDAPSEWIEVQPGEWVNPITGGRSTPSPCGWCGRRVVWPIEGDRHYNGVCVGMGSPRMWEPSERRSPTTVLAIRWHADDLGEGEDGKWIRDMSRALAQKISEQFENSEVSVKTYGTTE